MENQQPPAAETQETEVQAQETEVQTPVKRKVKYKADGEDFEEELDDQEIASRLSLAKAAHKRMSESSTQKKQMQQFLETLKKDPMAIFSDDRIMGNQKFKELAEQFLIKQLEDEALSPEEKQHRERDRRLKEYEEKEAKQKEAEQVQKNKQLEERHRKQYEATIVEALKASSLPKNLFTVSRMASLMQKNLKHGLDLTPQQLSQLVREDYQKEIKSLIGSSEPEAILSMLGQEVSDKIRKHDLSKFQPKNPINHKEPAKSEEPPKKMSSREYDEWLRAKWQK